MTKITNQYGIEIDFDAALNIMDDELVEELSGEYETEQDFFDAYAAAHLVKFAVEFEPAKKNPVW